MPRLRAMKTIAILSNHRLKGHSTCTAAIILRRHFHKEGSPKATIMAGESMKAKLQARTVTIRRDSLHGLRAVTTALGFPVYEILLTRRLHTNHRPTIAATIFPVSILAILKNKTVIVLRDNLDGLETVTALLEFSTHEILLTRRPHTNH